MAACIVIKFTLAPSHGVTGEDILENLKTIFSIPKKINAKDVPELLEIRCEIYEIDVKPREFLKQIGLNYAHGTGHGVGYFLNVHEGPQALSNLNKVKLKAGMVLSNEPGYYKNGEFGIRIENLVIIKKLKSRLQFEDLTLAPIDKSLIIKKLLNKQEKKQLIIWMMDFISRLPNNLVRQK